MTHPVPALVKQATQLWLGKRGPRMGAALAYYSAFSLAPMLLIAIAVAGYVYGDEAVTGTLAGQLEAQLGIHAAAAVEEMLAAVERREGGLLFTLMGLTMLFIGATTVFAELQSSLDDLWEAGHARKAGLRGTVRARGLSFVLVLALGVLLVLFLFVSSGMAALAK